ncbi:MAG: hypothetical protein L6R39_000097 [Caloplaca ligustica]|nr:MAG: hypothetical protein L6R39_000097 [Caloplaca ligustica]
MNMSSPYFDIQSHVLPGQHIREYPAATADSQEDTLRLHVNQYTPANRQSPCPDGAVTIIAAHANGFPKELYEPLWEDLCRSSEQKGLHIRCIWMADVANQGMSSVLNEDKLGNDLWVAIYCDDICETSNIHGLNAGRTNLALIHPRLLSSLVLIDPVIELPSARPRNTAAALLTQLSTFRRDWWPSREEAEASFRKQKFYQSWDERVLQRWLDACLRDTPTALYPENGSDPIKRPVTLLTSKHQEVFTFLRPNFDGMDSHGRFILNRSTHPDLDLESGETYPFYRPEVASTFKRLPYLRPSVLYVHAGTSDLSAPELREQRMNTTGVGVGGSGGAVEGRVKQVMFEDAGHLMPMEIAGKLADVTTDWLAQEIERWKEQEKAFQEQWSRKSRLEKQTVSAEWKRRVGGDPRAGANKPQL